MQLQLVPSNDTIRLTRLLHDADENEERIVSSIEDAVNTAYVVFDDALCIGALIICWQKDESEILYLAVDEPFRGRGYGTAAITQIIAEARHRDVHSLIVGTANSSLDNIAFYQKCGFRLDSIRRDYFDYLADPVYEHGILMRDMLVLRFVITSDSRDEGKFISH